MITDPNAESPDLIDQRDPNDPSHFDPKPGDPSVTPGITLPTTIPAGWTIAADGSMVPLAEAPPPVITLPEMTITGSPPPSGNGPGVALLIGAAVIVALLAARGAFR
jgi:hypothetical protein